MRTYIITLLLLVNTSLLFAQFGELQSIRISIRSASRVSNTLIYSLSTASFTYQKTPSSKLESVAVDTFILFNDSAKIVEIEQMFDTFHKYEAPCTRKPEAYRLELVYKKNGSKYRIYESRKTKTYDFATSYYRSVCDKDVTDSLDNFILEYWRIRKQYKLNAMFR